MAETATDLQSRFAFDQATEARFAAYHAANPQVYVTLRRFALEAKRRGVRRLGIAMLFERARWFTNVEGQGDSFKLNNSHRAYYSRLLMEQEPELAGFFETRKQRRDH